MGGEFPSAQITGLDLSPQMLSVAELRERQLEAAGGLGGRRRINYLHANMDENGLPAGSYDLVTVQFVMHECPAAVSAGLVSLRGATGGGLEWAACALSQSL
jgi:ubiquinone/menaquinone biosynthesis C-methylase UbiE